jgi:hypothetical protein
MQLCGTICGPQSPTKSCACDVHLLDRIHLEVHSFRVGPRFKFINPLGSRPHERLRMRHINFASAEMYGRKN